MKPLRLAVALIFVLSTGVALFGFGQTAYTVLQTHVFPVCELRYQPPPVPADPVAPTGKEQTQPITQLQPQCIVDYNNANRQIIQGSTMLLTGVLFGFPAFWFLYKTRKEEN